MTAGHPPTRNPRAALVAVFFGLAAGQEAYVRVESLRSWATNYGIGTTIGRDTFYARLILPQTARVEIAQSFFDGGN